MHRYPEVRVVMRVTNRVVDLFEDSIDVALRVRSDPPENANIVVRPLWRTQQMLVGAPSLLQAECAAARAGRSERVSKRSTCRPATDATSTT